MCTWSHTCRGVICPALIRRPDSFSVSPATHKCYDLIDRSFRELDVSNQNKATKVDLGRQTRVDAECSEENVLHLYLG
jgi:hypothetical protein